MKMGSLTKSNKPKNSAFYYPQNLGVALTFSQKVRAKPIRFFKSIRKLTPRTHASDVCYEIVFGG